MTSSNMHIDSGDSNHTSYRFEGLLLAIEFFTQRFHIEQLSEFSFEFINEILTLNASALFIRDGERFVMKQKRLYSDKEYFIPYTGQLRRLVTFHGRTVNSDFAAFFDPKDVAHFDMKWVIPLMIDDSLHGFIVSNGKIMGRFTAEDVVMSDTLMRLINNSLENSKHFDELQQSNHMLDQKIFNLFAINHSTKALLSEVHLYRLHEIATDVFSEVSSSQITSFGVVDPITGRLKITGYRNVTSYKNYYGDFELYGLAYNGPVVLHRVRDQERIRALFVNPEQLLELEAEYIILIVKERIIGIVTLSLPVNDRVYDESTFELIESLATSTFIAISNAILFQEANRQRESAEIKLKLLVTLNKLIRNLNECTTPDELCYFTLKTLQKSFGIRKAMICLREGDDYIVKEAIGWEPKATAEEQVSEDPAIDLATDLFTGDLSPAVEKAVDIKGRTVLSLPLPDWAEACIEGETLSDYMEDGAACFFSEEVLQWMGASNGAVIAPLTLGSRLVRAYNPYPLGFLIVLEAASSLQEEEVLVVDTVAKNISPVLHQMSVTSTVREQYKPDERRAFIRALKEHIKGWELYQIDFFVSYQVYKEHPFAAALQADSTESGQGSEQMLFSFDGYHFMISAEPIADLQWRQVPNQHDLEAVLTYSYTD
ncbi:GAF domain-containing protein [Paenibacillus agricola]|uniref:GAF domain-containing protein n=1 Tax=Paenibacillus agricola TaxID=2716264 RepID=A0ABX0J5A7_9BACL|nr:GAF domain-containing protein [Paenibacillus agricola]NHN31582.1 hypothetical protein [Paenibacillus agricola]